MRARQRMKVPCHPRRPVIGVDQTTTWALVSPPDLPFSPTDCTSNWRRLQSLTPQPLDRYDVQPACLPPNRGRPFFNTPPTV